MAKKPKAGREGVDRRSLRTDGEKTRTAILDAAERLFSDHGIDATSLRKIMKRAKVSASLINYHFGTRENLIRAILHRRTQNYINARFRILDDAAGLSGEEKLREMLHAFLFSIADADALKSDELRRMLRIVGHLSSSPEPWAAAILEEFFDAFQIRFVAELKKEFPHLSEAEIYWRLHLLRCVNIHTPMGTGRTRHIAKDVIDPGNPEEVTREMFPLLLAAFKVPGRAGNMAGEAPGKRKPAE